MEKAHARRVYFEDSQSRERTIACFHLVLRLKETGSEGETERLPLLVLVSLCGYNPQRFCYSTLVVVVKSWVVSGWWDDVRPDIPPRLLFLPHSSQGQGISYCRSKALLDPT
jgi:hypothetical protein